MATLMHIVSRRWVEGRPHLVDQDGRLLAPAGPFHWTVGARTCVGYRDGAWNPCPDAARVGYETQCLACFRGRGDPRRSRDLPDCIFEPRCRGVPEHCVCSFGGGQGPVPHVVYVALFGGLPKVGMTQAWRFEQRLREQGADAGFVVARLEDRQAARATEQQVAMLHGIPEARRHRETFPQLARPQDWRRIEAAATQWMDALRVRYPVEEELVRFEHTPPLPARPHRVHVGRAHEGEWLDGRGAYWFYRPRVVPLDVGQQPVLALRHADLLGRWIEVH